MVESLIGYKFNNLQLLEQALTHPSANKEKNVDKNNQRLEFLGDSVLKLIQSQIFYEKNPQWNEGQLSQTRNSYENNKTLGQWCQKLGIDKHMICANGINEQSASWNKICAQSFEAILGAIWIDCNYNFLKIMNLYQSWNLEIDQTINFKQQLQENLHARKLNLPVYKVVSMNGPSHKPVYYVSCQILIDDVIQVTYAQGSTIKQAEQLSAEKMIEKLPIHFTQSDQISTKKIIDTLTMNRHRNRQLLAENINEKVNHKSPKLLTN